MCGIAGFASPSPFFKIAEASAMAKALAHRGPDGEGLVAFRGDGTRIDCSDSSQLASLALAHRRLSIIDLDGGAQPLCNEDASVWVVFNGEIYNYIELADELRQKGHVLRSSGDTETLVHLWEEFGEQLCDKLVGMFSFAIYDTRAKTVFFARDRFGEKPLYLWQTDRGGLAFASELQAFWCLPGFSQSDMDIEGAAQYFRYGFVPSPRTIYKRVKSLPPGHSALWRAEGGLGSFNCYWRPRVASAGRRPGDDELAALLDESVRLRLRSDVPLGAFLSGGIDSALISQSASKQLGALNTFTIKTPGEGDESLVAASVAAKLNCTHREFAIEPDIVKISEKLAIHYGQPFADYSAVPTHLVSASARNFVKVVLSGDGGDEIFAGYERYTNYRYMRMFSLLPSTVRKMLVAGLRNLAPVGRPFAGELSDFIMNSGPFPARGENVTSMFHEFWRLRAYTSELAAADSMVSGAEGAAFSKYYQEAVGDSPLERWLEVDQRFSLGDDILAKVDIASMSVALECRAPFLDHRLAEFANSLPMDMKISLGVSKKCLRALAAGRVSPEISRLPKKGFTLPLKQWLRGTLKPWADSILFGQGSGWENLLKPESVRLLWNEHMDGKRDHSMRLWQIIAYELWRKSAGLRSI